jgi:hypothetical protein
MTYRSAVPPLVLILAATAGTLACDNQAHRQGRIDAFRRDQEWTEGQRREAETAPPTPEVLEQVRAATASFLSERHPELGVEGITLTPLTPNLFLVGASVKDLLKENRYVAQLTAERLQDVDWDGEFTPNGRLLWVVDYASAEKMRDLSRRHGFGEEVDRIRNQDPQYRTSWGRRSWLDDYLLWHYLFHRPASCGYRPGSGFTPMPPGYRFQDPGRPITPEDATRFQSAAAPTGGRSMVFLGGNAWRPPLLSGVDNLSGSVYAAGPHGSVSAGGPVYGAGKAFAGGRGGFGAAGRAAGTGG